MKLITNRISTGNAKSFEDFVADFKRKNRIKTASVKTAEQDEADSSGQLDVEPLHQEGESTTMPKAGPSAKKDDGDKSAAATTQPDEEGKDSGQPKAEGSEKFTNDPKVEKDAGCDGTGGNGKGNGPGKGKGDGQGDGTGTCGCGNDDCKECTATMVAAIKTAGEKGMCSCGKPNFICKGKCKGGDDSSDDSSDDDKEEKEAKVDKDDKEEKEEAKTDKDKEEKEAATKCDKCDCDPCTCKEASKKVKFVKIANLDEKNKGFLREYWRQLFGDDYVSAIIADK